MKKVAETPYKKICAMNDIPHNAGVCALVDGKQIALFRIGYENEHITAKAYNKDGLLLQMGDSMKPIDEIIKSKSGITGPNKFSLDNPRISDSRLVQILASSQLEI